VTLAFPDLGKQGNLLGFVGMEPKVTDSTISSANPDLMSMKMNTSLHIEGFYQLTDNIAITPGRFGLQLTSTMTMMILSSVRSNDIHF